MNIIQFMPYFPPHKGGLETVGEQIGISWVKNDLGNFINVITSFNQEKSINEYDKIVYKGEVIGYIKDGIKHLVIPSYEIITNFPLFGIGNLKKKLIFSYLKEYIKSTKNETKVVTHTRFFLPSLVGGKFARKNGLDWIHIEHGSSYVILSSKFNSFIAFIYDRLIGKWIFKKSDKILAISGVSRDFITKNFVNRNDIEVFYRGVDIPETQTKNGKVKFLFVGRLVALKGVKDLLEAYKLSKLKNELVIIGDGEEKNELEKQSEKLNVKFLGSKDNTYVIDYLKKNNIIFVNPSYSEGLPTTVIEGLLTGNVVIASDVGGTKEISNKKDLILFNSGDIKDLSNKMKKTIQNFEKLKGLSLENVRDKFNWDKNILVLYDLIEKGKKS